MRRPPRLSSPAIALPTGVPRHRSPPTRQRTTESAASTPLATHRAESPATRQRCPIVTPFAIISSLRPSETSLNTPPRSWGTVLLPPTLSGSLSPAVVSPARKARVWLRDERHDGWGTDLVSETVQGDLWAAQAKLYDGAYAIEKADVDSFLSESARVWEHQASTLTGAPSMNQSHIPGVNSCAPRLDLPCVFHASVPSGRL